MRNRKCNTELKGITLKQSILCLKHEWIGEISEELNEFQSSVLYNQPISQSCNDIIGMDPPGIGEKCLKKKKSTTLNLGKQAGGYEKDSQIHRHPEVSSAK